MKKYFITYGDEKFTKAKERILFEASNVSWLIQYRAMVQEI